MFKMFAAALILTGTLFAQGTEFEPHVDYGGQKAPLAVAVADFNLDGSPDLAVASSAHNGVRVLLGQGDGTFRPLRDFKVGFYPQSVAVGDFNRDGRPDLVTANYDSFGSGSVSVLLGNGDGTFQPRVDYMVGVNSKSVAVADFDRDGNLDIASANLYFGNVSVLLGNGDGTFQKHRDFAVCSVLCEGVAVGDFNGDNNPDLAIATLERSDTGHVSVLLGNGHGNFQRHVDYPIASAGTSVAVGDLNGDGSPDLVTSASCGFEGISVLLGNGDGTFNVRVDYGTGIEPVSVAVSDLNGDGKLDVVTANLGSSENSVSVLLGNGDGTFQQHVDYETDSRPESVAVGDFNLDGAPDLATANVAGNTVSVLLNSGEFSEWHARRGSTIH